MRTSDKVDSCLRELNSEAVHVRVAGASGEDLVTDHEEGSGWVGHEGSVGRHAKSRTV